MTDGVKYRNALEKKTNLEYEILRRKLNDQLGKDISKLLSQEEFSDIYIKLDEKQLKLHSCILRCRTPNFHNIILYLTRQTNSPNLSHYIPSEGFVKLLREVYGHGDLELLQKGEELLIYNVAKALHLDIFGEEMKRMMEAGSANRDTTACEMEELCLKDCCETENAPAIKDVKGSGKPKYAYNLFLHEEADTFQRVNFLPICARQDVPFVSGIGTNGSNGSASCSHKDGKNHRLEDSNKKEEEIAVEENDVSQMNDLLRHEDEDVENGYVGENKNEKTCANSHYNNNIVNCANIEKERVFTIENDNPAINGRLNFKQSRACDENKKENVDMVQKINIEDDESAAKNDGNSINDDGDEKITTESSSSKKTDESNAKNKHDSWVVNFEERSYDKHGKYNGFPSKSKPSPGGKNFFFVDISDATVTSSTSANPECGKNEVAAAQSNIFSMFVDLEDSATGDASEEEKRRRRMNKFLGGQRTRRLELLAKSSKAEFDKESFNCADTPPPTASATHVANSSADLTILGRTSQSVMCTSNVISGTNCQNSEESSHVTSDTEVAKPSHEGFRSHASGNLAKKLGLAADLGRKNFQAELTRQLTTSLVYSDRFDSSYEDAFVKLSDMDKKAYQAASENKWRSVNKMNRLIRGGNSGWFENKILTEGANSLSLSRIFPKLSKNIFEKNSAKNSQHLLVESESVSSDSRLQNGHFSFPNENNTSALGRDLLRMFLDEISPDVIVEASGHKIKAHKCILTSRCLYFAALFSGGWAVTSNVISFPNFSYNVVHFALCHIYSGTGDIPDYINIVELTTFADMLCLEGLREVITYNLKMKYCHFFHKPCGTCSVGVLECLPLAITYSLDEIRRKSLNWIRKHHTRLWPTKAFSSLPSEIVEMCYNQHIVHMTTENVFETLLNCDKLNAATTKSRWSDSINALTARLHGDCIKFLANNFSNFLQSKAFKSLEIWDYSTLELKTKIVCGKMSMDEMCESLLRLPEAIRAVSSTSATLVQNNSERLKLLQNIESFLEMALIKRGLSIFYCDKWEKLSPEQRNKIQMAGGYSYVPPKKKPLTKNTVSDSRSANITLQQAMQSRRFKDRIFDKKRDFNSGNVNSTNLLKNIRDSSKNDSPHKNRNQSTKLVSANAVRTTVVSAKNSPKKLPNSTLKIKSVGSPATSSITVKTLVRKATSSSKPLTSKSTSTPGYMKSTVVQQGGKTTAAKTASASAVTTASAVAQVKKVEIKKSAALKVGQRPPVKNVSKDVSVSATPRIPSSGRKTTATPGRISSAPSVAAKKSLPGGRLSLGTPVQCKTAANGIKVTAKGKGLKSEMTSRSSFSSAKSTSSSGRNDVPVARPTLRRSGTFSKDEPTVLEKTNGDSSARAKHKN